MNDLLTVRYIYSKFYNIKERRILLTLTPLYRAIQHLYRNLEKTVFQIHTERDAPVDVDENGVMKDEVRFAKRDNHAKDYHDFIKKKAKTALLANRLDSILGSECFGKVFIDTDGFVKYIP